MRSDPGWTFGRVVGLIVGLIGLIGFGFCGLCGLVIGIGGGARDMGIFLAYSLPGLAIAWLFFLLVRKMIRDARRKSDPGSD